MIRLCSYCKQRFGHATGPAHLVTHGICPVCARVALADPMRTPDEIRRLATVPACQRVAGI